MLDQLIELTKSNQFFQGTFFVGIIAAIGYTLKGWFFYIYGRIKRRFTYVVVIEEKSALYAVLNEYLYNHHNKCFKNVEADLVPAKEGDAVDKETMGVNKSGRMKPIKVFNTNEKVLSLKQNIDSFILWLQGKPVYIDKRKDELKGANDIYSATKGAFEIKTIFGKHLIHGWLDEIISAYNRSLVINKEVNVYVSNHSTYDGWGIHKTFTPISLERVVCDDTAKLNLIADIEKWSGSKKAYANLGLTHKRSYLLYGEPGNGKTSIVMAIAREFERDIYYLDINGAANEEQLRRAFGTIPKRSILLMEDIDQIWGRMEDGKWNPRLPANKDCKITFSLFLNLLNGVLDKDDMLLFMTTNKLDLLDEALIRPGRVDYRMEVTKPTKALVAQYISNYYDKKLAIVTYNKNYSYAELLNLCKTHEDYNDTIRELC